MTFTIPRQHHEFDHALDALAALTEDDTVDVHMSAEEFQEYLLDHRIHAFDEELGVIV